MSGNFGKYTLTDRLAFGGMAEVFLATVHGEAGFVKTLVIKRLHQRLNEDAELVQMLIDEAQITVQLVHSNIGQVLDLGCVDGAFYIAMEYIAGEDVRTLLDSCTRRKIQFSIEAAAYIVSEILDGLDHAHNQLGHDGEPLQIVHRDVSPPNIMISYEGEVKIIDFGIAKARMRMVQTQAGVIKGKYRYMSPEQASGGTVDHRTDIFASGVVLYELLSGKPHSKGLPNIKVLRRMQNAEFEPIRRLRPDIPKAMEKIVRQALALRPGGRFASAGEFRDALIRFLRSTGAQYNRSELASFIQRVFGEERRRKRSGEARPAELDPSNGVEDARLARDPGGRREYGRSKERVVAIGPEPDSYVMTSRELLEETSFTDLDSQWPDPDQDRSGLKGRDWAEESITDLEKPWAPLCKTTPLDNRDSDHVPIVEVATDIQTQVIDLGTLGEDGGPIALISTDAPTRVVGMGPIHGLQVIPCEDEIAHSFQERSLEEIAAPDPPPEPLLSSSVPSGFSAIRAETPIPAGEPSLSRSRANPGSGLRILVGLVLVLVLGWGGAVALYFLHDPAARPDEHDTSARLAASSDVSLAPDRPRRIDQPAPRQELIRVQSTPPGARIVLCGKLTGQVTPARLKARIVKPCRLELLLAGYESYELPVMVPAGRPINIVASLRRSRSLLVNKRRVGTLSVTSGRVGSVYLDNREVGLTPRLDLTLLPGTYSVKIRFSDPERVSRVQRVTIRASEIAKVHFNPGQ